MQQSDIRLLRKSKGISQKALAAHMWTYPSMLCKIENGTKKLTQSELNDWINGVNEVLLFR